MRRGVPGTMERKKEGSLHLSFSSFPSRAPFSHASGVSSYLVLRVAIQVKTTGHQSIQGRNLYQPWLNYLAAKRKEKQLYCSRRVGGGMVMLSRKFFQMYSFQHSWGSIKADFYYWNLSTFVPFWNLCIQNRSPNLQAPGPKLLTVVYFSSSELLDYFRLHIRVQCSGNIEHSRLFLPPKKENHLPYYKLLRVDMCYTITTRWVFVRNNQ